MHRVHLEIELNKSEPRVPPFGDVKQWLHTEKDGLEGGTSMIRLMFLRLIRLDHETSQIIVFF